MATGVAPCTMFRSHSVDRTPAATAESCSESNLKFICKFWSGPPQTCGQEDHCGNEDDESVSVILPAQCSIYQLRLRICMKVCDPNMKILCTEKVVFASKHTADDISDDIFGWYLCFFLGLVSDDVCMYLSIQSKQCKCKIYWFYCYKYKCFTAFAIHG